MSSATAAQKRPIASATSTTTALAKPPCKIHPTAVVADKAQLTGTYQIEVGENTIIQPHAKINAVGGPVTIGANCIVFEAVVISVPEGSSNAEAILADYITVESGARVTAAKVGDHTEIGVTSVIEPGAVIGKYCKIAPKLVIKGDEHLQDYTVAFGDDRRRIDTTTASNDKYRESRSIVQRKHIDVLRRIIPNAASKWSSV